MKVENLTPHDVVIRPADGPEVTIPPSGIVPRVEMHTTPAFRIHLDDTRFVDVVHTSAGEVRDLPDPEPDTIYIVSRQVAEAVPYRYDLVVPDDAIRDEKGRIVAVRRLARVAPPR